MAYPLYPQDPRVGLPIKLSDDHVERLCNGKMLHQTVIDYLIQRASPIPHKPMERFGFIVCGSTGAMLSMTVWNKGFLSTPQDTRLVLRTKKKMNAFRQGKYTIVVPHVSQMHFFVLSITLDERNSDLYEMVDVYDSLVKPGRSGGIGVHEEATAFLRVFNDFWHNFVSYDTVDAHRIKRERYLLQLAEIRDSPQQPKKSLNCGLFTVAVCLHLLEGLSVNSTTFDEHTI